MTGESATARELLSARKIAVQLLGFAIGLGLLVWCIWIAVSGDGEQWRRIVHADPWLVLGLAGCSLISMLMNGAIFWLVMRPIQPVSLADMTRLNLVTALLNYAPIRAGLIARVAYHLRVDRMSILTLLALFAALTHTLALTLGACVVATIVHPRFDLVWFALLFGQLLIAGLLTWAVMGHGLAVRFGQGMEQMLRDPVCLWGAMGLRLVDIGAFVGRMAFAAMILELTLAPSEIMLLGFAALAVSLNPLGRVGFREIAIAFVASRLVSGTLSPDQVDSEMATLALVESAGEAMVAIPSGTIALLWYRRRWRQAGEAAKASAAS